MKYVYKKTEPSLWTVGFYAPDGTWIPESDHGSREKAAERVRWLAGYFSAKDGDRKLIDRLGKTHGYGYLMNLLRDLWAEHLQETGVSGIGAFEVGPAIGLTTECGCERPAKCAWCCGTGWVTERVKEAKEQLEEKGFVLEFEGRSDLVTTLMGMFFDPEQIRNLHKDGLLSFNERVEALAKHAEWNEQQREIVEVLNKGAVRGSFREWTDLEKEVERRR